MVIVNDDQKIFNVVGPMSNDEKLNADVCAEQMKGRNVRCFTSGNYQTKEELVAETKKELNLVYNAEFQI